jgi:hypothetical protein
MSSTTTKHFSYSLAIKDGVARLAAQNAINEEFDIPVEKLAGASLLEFDLSGITWINSVGIRKFSQWLWEIESKMPNLKVSLVKVQPFVVRQVNLIHSQFGSNLRVDSMYVPFYCNACDLDDATILVTRDQVKASDNSNLQISGNPCRKCGQPMEMDVMDNYFRLMRER